MDASLVILRGSSAAEDSCKVVEAVLDTANVQVIAQKRVQGFGQIPQLASGFNEIYVVSAGQTVHDALASLTQTYGDEVKCVFGEEAVAAIAKLFPELVEPADAEILEEHEVSTSASERRVFTFDEPTAPLTAEALADKQAELDESTSEELSLPSNPSLILSDSVTSTSQSFKARAAPKSLGKAAIQPRLTKAAMLRMGLTPPAPLQRAPSSLSESSSTKPTSSITRPRTSTSSSTIPRSLAQPTIAVRTNRAAQIRASGAVYLGAEPAVKPSIGRRQSTGTAERSSLPTYENVPGHRRKSLQPVIVRQPDFVVKQNRAAALRAGGEVAEQAKITRQSCGTADRSNNPAFDNIPGFKRKSLARVDSTKQPAAPVRLSKAAALRMGVQIPESTRAKKASMESLEEENDENVQTTQRSSSLRSTRPPSITPRLNKASSLRSAIDRPRSSLALADSPRHINPPSPTASRRPSSAMEKSNRAQSKSGTLTARVRQPIVHVDKEDNSETF